MAKAPVKKTTAPVARSVESLKMLLSQINALAPNRSKASDGWIGDVKHMERHSDHNPEPDDTVDARDFTNDPSGGCDARKLAQAILDSRDPRLSYVISNGEIASGRKGPKPWVWRKYTGANGHYHHAHVSVLDEGQDDKTPWKIESAFKKVSTPPNTSKPVLTSKQVNSVMHLGSKGDFVKTLQTNLKSLGYQLTETDGIFGPETDDAVRRFQKDAKLDKVDGWAGPDTVAAISKELEKRKTEPKIAAASKVVDSAAADGKRFSTTEVVTAITGVTGTATVVKQGVDSVKDSASSFMDLAATVGPWVLLGLVVAGGAAYVIYDRRNKRLEALKVQKVL